MTLREAVDGSEIEPEKRVTDAEIIVSTEHHKAKQNIVPLY